MPRAVIFDLDHTLIDRRPAWRYALEQAVSAVTGQRVDAGPLVDEYHQRPVPHAIALLVPTATDRPECARLWHEMFYRSALKRLLVHEGVGMGLDRLKSARVEVGVVTRELHRDARRQVESTGLDRFLSVMSATAAEAPWQVTERLADCLAFLEYRPADCVFVSADAPDLAAAADAGFTPFAAAWVPTETPAPYPSIPTAHDAAPTLAAYWPSVTRA
ncbi:MAG TPA: HAD hydrolase-like protein [Tepidiformaceae bacterium]|nr:HAD hydrolase-like protein [Tepidiformaceae bacterium]